MRVLFIVSVVGAAASACGPPECVSERPYQARVVFVEGVRDGVGFSFVVNDVLRTGRGGQPDENLGDIDLEADAAGRLVRVATDGVVLDLGGVAAVGVDDGAVVDVADVEFVLDGDAASSGAIVVDSGSADSFAASFDVVVDERSATGTIDVSLDEGDSGCV